MIRLAAVLAFAGVAAAPPSPITAIAGHYVRTRKIYFQEAIDRWKPKLVDDVAEIVPVDATHAYFDLELNFSNGQLCGLTGVAVAQGAELVYSQATPISAGVPCTLHISRRGNQLTWSDKNDTCRVYCGSNGTFQAGSLPWSSKRPIRHLSRLKASSAYRDALTEWRTGVPSF